MRMAVLIHTLRKQGAARRLPEEAVSFARHRKKRSRGNKGREDPWSLVSEYSSVETLLLGILDGKFLDVCACPSKQDVLAFLALGTKCE